MRSSCNWAENVVPCFHTRPAPTHCTALALPPRCDRWSETLDNLKQNAVCSLYSVELQSNSKVRTLVWCCPFSLNFSFIGLYLSTHCFKTWWGFTLTFYLTTTHFLCKKVIFQNVRVQLSKISISHSMYTLHVICNMSTWYSVPLVHLPSIGILFEI